MTATDTLLAAGRALAEIADPDKDLLNFGNDFRALALTLRFIGEGLDQAYETAEDRRDWLAGGYMINTANVEYQQSVAEALGTAKRTAQRALVDLAKIVGELETQMAVTERLRFARGGG